MEVFILDDENRKKYIEYIRQGSKIVQGKELNQMTLVFVRCMVTTVKKEITGNNVSFAFGGETKNQKFVIDRFFSPIFTTIDTTIYDFSKEITH